MKTLNNGTEIYYLEDMVVASGRASNTSDFAPGEIRVMVSVAALDENGFIPKQEPHDHDFGIDESKNIYYRMNGAWRNDKGEIVKSKL